METIYQQRGFPTRAAYLEDLADSYGVPLDYVYCLSDLLGENEDFDGLVTACQDYQEGEGA